MPIRVLPIGLVNKIAAGEVIERPSSVVKELVENSLDAGATAIEVAIEDGGRRLIRITDDGAGMGEEDIRLAFAPHATSKIVSEDDLFDIRTMGFRGEALASIAAVSMAQIRSRRRELRENASEDARGREDASDDIGGHEVEASGGEISPVRPCAAPAGTTVTVRELFFNVPARRKFLRMAATESGHVAEQMTRLALARPDVAFSLSHNGRSVMRLARAAGTMDRAGDLFGEELAAGLMPISRRQGAIVVAGLIGTPSSARASGKWQYFFLNGRYIRDRLLSHALREAYRGACEPSRWPVGIVFVEIDPAEVDVNVHPTKIEVRFRDSDRVHGEVLAALRETLNRAGATRASLAGAARADQDPASEVAGPQAAPDAAAGGTAGLGGASGQAGEGAGRDADDDRRQSLRQAMADFFRSAGPRQPRFSFPDAATASRGEASPSATAEFPLAGSRDSSAGTYEPAVSQPAPGPFRAPSPRAQSSQSESSWADSAPRADSKPPAPPGLPAAVMQVHDSYIVAASVDGLLIIDQHALHERILYNELKERLAGEGGLEGQRMLIPAPVRVTEEEAAALASRESLLRRLGMEVAPFGPGCVAVQIFPSVLLKRGVRPEEMLQAVLDELAESPGAGPEAILDEVISTMACKAAVKAGQALSPAEMNSLLARAELAERSFACPHGRPSVLKLTLKDLEKQFKRS